MSSQSWGQLLVDLGASGTSYSTFTTAQSLLTTATSTAASAGLVQLPGGFFRVGAVLEYDVLLNMGSATGQTWTYSVKVGSAVAYTTGAIPVTTTTNAALPVSLKFHLRCLSVGNGTLATLIGTGMAMGIGVSPLGGATPAANTAAGMGFSPLNVTSLAAGAGFDSTTANTLDFFAASGTSSASNTIQLISLKVVSWGNTAP